MLCKDCHRHHQSSKATRGHHFCTLQEYEMLESHPFKVPMRCATHNKKYDAYCLSHERPCCIICVTSSHGKCTGVVAFDDALKGFNSKVAMADLGERLENITVNIENFLQNREKMLLDLGHQKESIAKTISDKRRVIDEYLDNIEDRLRQDLASKYTKCLEEINVQTEQIKKRLNKIDEIKKNFEQVKEKKSDLQMFLSTSEIQAMSREQEQFVDNIHAHLYKYEMSVKFDDSITNVSMSSPHFGNISVAESPCHLSLIMGPLKQPHVDVPWIFKPVQLKLMNKFSIKKGQNGLYINSGIILEDGRIVLTDKYNSRMMLYTESGTYQRDVALSGSPWDVTEVGKNEIAVSFPDSNLIEVVDIKTGSVIHKYKISGQCSGVEFVDGKITVSVAGDGIQVLDMKGHKLKTLPVEVTRETFLTGFAEKLYYTDYTTHTVHCTTFDHEQVYKFNHDELNFPQAISVDSDGHVFVTGFISNTLLCISPDGQHRQVLLRQADGLNSPTAVFFDRKRKLLLVCTNSASTVGIYEIVH